ncbi:MAG TPA: DUF2207 domain-containing protein [Candidatus Acidoferrum sp.]|nr:DUF2207 domain-containing protein [Candidatus Acidoferrum sp.]
MKKFINGFLLLAFLCLVPVSASAAGNVNDFAIPDYQIDYYLRRDAAGRSTLKTVETISAAFPDTDQNHGIERAIPSSYDGHETNLQVASVTDTNNQPLEYATYDSSDITTLRIGDPNTYVHGLHVYKITYTQRDVTRYFNDTNDDEFYWDTNGTGWVVPINTLTVRLHIAGAVAKALTGKRSCYQGVEGSTSTCVVTAAGDGFAASATQLGPNENVTLAVGFGPHTFTEYQPSVWQVFVTVWQDSLVVTFWVAALAAAGIAWRWYRRANRLSEITTIVPEYLPPKDASVSTSSIILHQPSRMFSAQLIDLAVRHYLKIYQTREKSLFVSANYELEIVKDIADLRDEEREVLKDIFNEPNVGARLDMATLKNNQSVSLRLSDNPRKVRKNIAGKYGLRAYDAQQSAWFRRAALVVLVAAVLSLSPWLLAVAIGTLLSSYLLRPLTDAGLALARYLKGLSMYIEVAETDRLRMLQSPEGALKLGAPIDTNDKRQLIKLYERVLPYAMLFGLETGWNKQLGQYYESVHEVPSWYVGNGAVFNAAMFSATISSFSKVASYGDPASSTSGGSGGGGFSGGGGGGGGGGGW